MKNILLYIIMFGTAILFITPFILEINDMASSEYEYIGEIKDFDISAGGFGHSDKCKVITNQTTVICSGYDCQDLVVGAKLYKNKYICKVE